MHGTGLRRASSHRILWLRLDSAADWPARCAWPGQTIAQNSNHRLRAHRLSAAAVRTWGRAFPFEILQLCFELRVWGALAPLSHRVAQSLFPQLCIKQSTPHLGFICIGLYRHWLLPITSTACCPFVSCPPSTLCVSLSHKRCFVGWLWALSVWTLLCIFLLASLLARSTVHTCYVCGRVQPGCAPEVPEMLAGGQKKYKQFILR